MDGSTQCFSCYETLLFEDEANMATDDSGTLMHVGLSTLLCARCKTRPIRTASDGVLVETKT